MTKIYIKKGYKNRYDNSLSRKKRAPLAIRQLKTKSYDSKANRRKQKERTTKKLKAKKSKAKISSSSSSSSSSLFPPPPSTPSSQEKRNMLVENYEYTQNNVDILSSPQV
jgi:hypothetical protein